MKKLLVLAVAAALLIGFSVPAMADVQLYGRVYFNTYILNVDKETVNGTNPSHGIGYANALGGANITIAGDGNPGQPSALFDDTDLIWGMDQTISRFGARFSSGAMSGLVEMRPWGGSQARHWYGAYDFGSFELLLGKWWDPVYFASEGVMALFGGGYAYGANPTGDAVARPAQLRLKVPLPNKLGEWYFSMQECYAVTGAVAAGGAGIPGTTTETDISLPKLATTLRLNFAPTSWLLYGNYQTYNEVGRTGTTDRDFDITAWSVGLSGAATFGPFRLGGNIWTGENPSNLLGAGGLAVYGWNARYLASNDSINDTDAWGFQLSGKFKFNDMISLEIAYQGTQLERPATTSAFGKDKNDYYQFDVVLPIVLAKGFILYPTVQYFDESDSTVNNVTTDEGSAIAYGFVWEINF